MPTRDLLIGLDSSTTACKAVVWDCTGALVAEGRSPLPMLKPRPAWHEQPSALWSTAAAESLRAALAGIDPRRLAGLAISAQRETFVVAGADGRPLDNALLWMDERCHALLPQIDALYGGQRIHQETGKPLSANLTLGKLYWMRIERPELFARIARVLDVHAVLAEYLTGRYATSWGCADPTGLFDMRLNAWDAPLIEVVGLRVEQFPESLPVGAPLGAVTSAAARETGLPEGLPVFAGLGDGQAAGLGVSAVHPGEAYLNLGTAVVAGTCTDRYLVDPAFRTMVAGVPGTYALETVLLGGAYTIRWFVENFAGQPSGETAPEEIFEAAAAQIAPGAQGLLLVPYWNSVMNPYWDASASGMTIGWRGIHGPAHFYRAILEGVALELRLHTSGVERALGQPVERFIAVGGGARSALWRQIIADVTGRPVYRAATTEASALGAGILAATGAGLFPSVLSAAQAMTSISAEPNRPRPDRHAFYSRLYEDVYLGIYPALRDALQRLADLSGEDAFHP